MKNLFCIVMCLAVCALHSAEAQQITGELSKANQKFVAHLNEGDVLILKYDLSRGLITREMEWTTYAVFCSTVGKAEIEVTNNSVHEVIKLPALMSAVEHGQENIGANIDGKGELKISNLSPYYSGTIVSCEFYHKFGL